MSRTSNAVWLGALVASTVACEDGTFVGSRGPGGSGGANSLGGNVSVTTGGTGARTSGGAAATFGGEFNGGAGFERGGSASGGTFLGAGGSLLGLGGNDEPRGGQTNAEGGSSGGVGGSSGGVGGNDFTRGGATTGGADNSRGGAASGGSGDAHGGAGGATATCSDGVRNGDELGIDCGGACKLCGGVSCETDTVCASGVCDRIAGTPRKCREVSCVNHRVDPGEVGVDCGGGGCALCPGAACEFDDHCESRNCGGFCLASACDDGVKNGLETGVDCGGPCKLCAAAPCTDPAQCQSGVCTGGTCRAPTCDDGVLNGRETDLDCGGSCAACGGSFCYAPADCASRICNRGQCTESSCNDGILNGRETNVDCGGSCLRCGGIACQSDGECSSRHCVDGRCSAPTCTDGFRNNRESDIDCGGPCAPCSTELICWSNSDCASGVCKNDRCVASSCSDGVRNGNEREIDCGGACAECSTSISCASEQDCPSGRCRDAVCTPLPSCLGTPALSCQGRSCCEAPVVPAGEFWLGGDPVNPAAQACTWTTSGISRAKLHSFRLDRFKVTVGRFRRFIEAGPAAWLPASGAGAHPLLPNSGFSSEWNKFIWASQDELVASPAYAHLSDDPNVPMVQLNWYQAFAFCIWDGGRLPTEAEWEYAASGGDANRPYPWGFDPPNHDYVDSGLCAQRDCTQGPLWRPVGTHWLGGGRFGHQDLEGSSGEWVLDYGDSSHSVTVQRSTPCDNCANLTPYSDRIVRGGYPNAIDNRLCSTYRIGLPPASSESYYSAFRCARDL